MPLPTVLLDRKIETLLTEWNKNPDMLFTIHPVDGTFLVWHVKYLDEYNPGIFRQVQVYFPDENDYSFFLISYFLYLHFKCYLLSWFSPLPLPSTFTPIHQPTHSCFLALAFTYTGT
jgi:hypothetical protein